MPSIAYKFNLVIDKLKIRKNRKGQIRTIEAFFSALLIISTLLLTSSISYPNKEEALHNLISIGMNALLELDSNGTLAKLIDSQDWLEIKKSLEALLPNGVWFNLTVFDDDMTLLNQDFSITNGKAPSQRKVSIEYLCISRNPAFQVYTLRLQLAKAG